MSNIVIAGYGFVGKAHEELLKHTNTIYIVDPIISDKRVYDFNADAVIICVATPPNEHGSCEYKHILEVLSDTTPSTPVLIKSTVSLEGWREIIRQYPNHDISFSPEFLRQATYIEDILSVQTMYISSESFTWLSIFRNAYKNTVEFKVLPAEELILVKYFTNTFLATKVTFFNQLYDLSKAASISYSNVAIAIGTDKRIGTSHTQVTAERGYGGHCFPKDMQALANTGDVFGTNLKLIKSAIQYNNEIKKTLD